MKIYNRYGKLPSLDEKLEGDQGNYEGWEDIQIRFGFVFFEFGLNVYDIRDDYAVLFQKPSPDGSIPNWVFHSWNDKFLSVNKDYFKTYTYWICLDLEFTPKYETSTRDEAWQYYIQQKKYYKELPEGWVKRKI